MEFITNNVHRGQFIVRDFDPFRVLIQIKLTLNCKP